MSDLPRLRTPAVVSPPVALRLSDAARALGLSVRSVQRLIASGDLAASRLGRAVVVQARDLQALLDRTRIGVEP